MIVLTLSGNNLLNVLALTVILGLLLLYFLLFREFHRHDYEQRKRLEFFIQLVYSETKRSKALSFQNRNLKSLRGRSSIQLTKIPKSACLKKKDYLKI